MRCICAALLVVAAASQGARAEEEEHECDAGKYLRGTRCYNCPRGRYTSAKGAESFRQCKPCGKGRYAAAGGSACSVCPAGKWNAYISRTTCYSCPAGKYLSTAGGTSYKQCKSCAKGKYSAKRGATSASGCTACPAGKWNAYFGRGACYNCMPGRYSAGTVGATSYNQCKVCPQGTYMQYTKTWQKGPAPTSVKQCKACPTGKTTASSTSFAYHNQKSDCKYNIFNMHGLENKCEGGTYAKTVKRGSKTYRTCARCPPGRYSQFVGLTSPKQCRACAKGRWLPYSGRTTGCYGCPAGKYGTRTGATRYNQCTYCRPGTYSAVRGASAATTCTACPSGRYTQYHGRTNARQCYGCPRGKTTTSHDRGSSSHDQRSDCNAPKCQDNERLLKRVVHDASCKSAKAENLCKTESAMAQRFCALTCGLCKASGCVDKSKSCPRYAKQCGKAAIKALCCHTCSTAKVTPTSALVDLGWNGCQTEGYRCPACQGDCDVDTDCQKGLRCFQRTNIQAVPGCTGHGNPGHDYCYNPQSGGGH